MKQDQKGVGHILYEVLCYIDKKKIGRVAAKEGANLLDVLRMHQIPVDAVCSGKGICGKCRVQVIEGYVPVTEQERQFFTEQELLSGYRLACKAHIYGDLSIQIGSGYTHIQTLGIGQAQAGTGWKEAASGQRKGNAAQSGNGQGKGNAAQAANGQGKGNAAQSASGQRKGNAASVQAGSSAPYGQMRIERLRGCRIAVDLGSTTLAAVLLDAQGKLLAQASAVNPQRAYGADVISRIQASNEGMREQLRVCICRGLQELFLALLEGSGKAVQVTGIAVAGNTTMLHLLRGYSCEKLGQAPFTPVSLEQECLPYDSLFAPTEGCSGSLVYLLPGISAFVGADITAGFYSSGFWQTGKDAPAFFIDLGTNGEMAFGSRDGYVTTSTAAGPAFEGARLSCGVPGIPGAICKVSYLYHRVRIQTIGRKKPCGVCGTGAMEAVSALLSEGLMDADGLLAPQLFEKGMMLARREDGSGIFLTQSDIREIQMAKAAIRSGIEILYQRYHREFQKPGRAQISRIYLAGGFGYSLSADTAVSIGLFPPGWKERIVAVGNTSLKGAVAFFTDQACAAELENIRSKNRSIRLESDPDFQDLYIREMRFPQRYTNEQD
ncbi:MAG: ASKHA domain-containing protein [Eubacterium sp.]|nr:ASKHA domain-containing protein [Eubacterium sp.]